MSPSASTSGWITQWVPVAAVVVWASPGAVVVQRRMDPGGFGAGLLEFPGGKIEPGETPRAAALRELREEWGAPAAGCVTDLQPAETLHHRYPGGPSVSLWIFHGRVRGGPEAVGPHLPDHAVTMKVARLAPAAFLEADRPFVRRLRDQTVCYPWRRGTPPAHRP